MRLDRWHHVTLLGGDGPQGRHESDDPAGEVVALVLAAGEGRRFGPAVKQLADLGGQPLVRWPVAAAVAAGVHRVLVVVGHRADAVAGAVTTPPWPPDAAGVEVVVNEHHAAGQGTSLATGVARLLAGPAPRATVVLLGDQPGVGSEAVRAVVAAVLEGAVAARASYHDGPSHPVAFGPAVLPRLVGSQGDRGARGLLEELEVVPVGVDGLAPRDVDTPEDLAAVRVAMGSD